MNVRGEFCTVFEEILLRGFLGSDGLLDAILWAKEVFRLLSFVVCSSVLVYIVESIRVYDSLLAGA